AASLVSYGACAVVVADDPALAEPLADRYAKVIAEVTQAHGAKRLVGATSTFSKDILPRVGALLGLAMVRGVFATEEVEGSVLYRRPTNAGSALATVRVESDRFALTVRPTAFEAAATGAASCPIERFAVDVASLPLGTEFISREQRMSDRPEL